MNLVELQNANDFAAILGELQIETDKAAKLLSFFDGTRFEKGKWHTPIESYGVNQTKDLRRLIWT